jgi:hypothetical protein
MPEELLFLAAIVLMVWALVELVQTESTTVRTLPKLVWAVLVVVIPFAAIAWFLFGRPRVAVPAGAAPPTPAGQFLGRRATAARPAPDDDPDFLARLNAKAAQQRKLRRSEDENAAPDDPEADAPH